VKRVSASNQCNRFHGLFSRNLLFHIHSFAKVRRCSSSGCEQIEAGVNTGTNRPVNDEDLCGTAGRTSGETDSPERKALRRINHRSGGNGGYLKMVDYSRGSSADTSA
jgi:hypothetical protein